MCLLTASSTRFVSNWTRTSPSSTSVPASMMWVTVLNPRTLHLISVFSANRTLLRYRNVEIAFSNDMGQMFGTVCTQQTGTQFSSAPRPITVAIKTTQAIPIQTRRLPRACFASLPDIRFFITTLTDIERSFQFAISRSWIAKTSFSTMNNTQDILEQIWITQGNQIHGSSNKHRRNQRFSIQDVHCK